MFTKAALLTHLDNQKLSYTLYEHPAVFTVEESQLHCGHIAGVHCKNLFLKDKKDKLWLVTAPDERVIDLKNLPGKINSARLTFAKPELLMEVLGVLPGSVTPLALINDIQKRVTPVLDAWMLRQPLLNYHPLINTATVAMPPNDLLRFIDGTGHQPITVEL
jgi:Ala-tRNA(Pro) deacylase